MIASKLATTSWSLARKSNMLSLRKALGINSSILYRSFTNDVREGVGRRATRTKIFIKEQTGFSGASSEATPITIGKGFLAGASVIGIGSLCYYGLGFSNQAGILEKSSIWPSYVRERISSTFQYLGGGLAVTAASAYGISRTPALMNLAMGSGWMAVLASMALVIGSGMIVRSLPYEPGKLTSKQVAWAAHAALLGAFIAPLTLLGGPIMTRAALYTAGIVGGLSAVAATAPSEKFLNMGGPLAIGLGVVFAASLGSMFFPPTMGSRLGLSLYSVSIYGGLVLFSMFLLYDTQKIVKKAEYGGHFDPVNESISVYLDILNIFIRMSHILAGGGGKRK